MERLRQKDSSAAKTSTAVGLVDGNKDSNAGVSMADAQIEFLRAQRRLTLESAAGRILSMFIGAVDTTRLLIFTTMAMLAQLPEEVQKLRDEQQQVLWVEVIEAALAVCSWAVNIDSVL